MAVEYTLTDTTWRPKTLVGFLTAHAEGLREPVLSEPVDRTGAVVRGRLFVDGSVRGVDLLFSGRLLRTAAIYVRIGMLASRTDWVLLFGLLRDLLKAGRGTLTDVDGDEVDANALTENEAAGLAVRQFADDAATIRRELVDRNRPFAALESPEYHLIVTSEDLNLDEDDPIRFGMALEERLAERARRYEGAVVLPVMQAGDATAFTYWPCCEALMDAVPFVAVARNETDEPRVIGARTFFQAMGAHVEAVSPDEDRFFLSGGAMPSDLEIAYQNGAPFSSWAASHTLDMT